MDIPQILTAIAVLITAVAAPFVARRGERTKAAQDKAVHEFEAGLKAVELYEGMAEARRAEAADERTQRQADRDQHAAAQAAKDAEVERIRAQCVATQLRLTNTITALIAIVHDEVAVSAAQTELAIANRHDLTEH